MLGIDNRRQTAQLLGFGGRFFDFGGEFGAVFVPLGQVLDARALGRLAAQYLDAGRLAGRPVRRRPVRRLPRIPRKG